MVSRAHLQERWLSLMRERLPNEAPERNWPVQFDHCFGRIIYDNVRGEEWSESLDSPAYESLTDEELRQCIGLAHRIINADDAYLRALNDMSLYYRDKLD